MPKAMGLDMQNFCLAHDNAFVIPAEALTEKGMDPALSSLLISHHRLTLAQIECLEQGFQRYDKRCRALHLRAPQYWFAPRQTNLMVVSDECIVVPYSEPFRGTSSMFYTSDFDTHPEYVAALFVHMERLSMLGHVQAAVAYNLSYWFEQDIESRQAFVSAASRARRPDAACFRALAEALGWIDELLHNPLRPPSEMVTQPCIRIEDAGLYVPKDLQPRLMALTTAAESAARNAMEGAVLAASVGAKDASTQTLDALCDWLVQTRAHLIVQATDNQALWSPDHRDPSQIRRVLADVNAGALAGIHADLRIIHERSRQFLDRVRDVDSLPKRSTVLEAGDGAYLDPARRAVVYELQPPVFDLRMGAAPPYHRLLLGARVMHEWGHLAHAAQILHLPDEQRSAYTQARTELGECFIKLLRGVPEFIKKTVAQELQLIEPIAAQQPKALARKTLARIGDYLANMMCARLIPGEEMQAYVRTNVRHHLNEDLGLVTELARYAYEVNYLDLAGLPRNYFFKTSRFPEHFIHTGIVSEAGINELFDAAGRVLTCYAIDPTRLSLPISKPPDP